MSVAAMAGVHATCIQLSSALSFSVSYDSLIWLAILLQFYFVLFRVLFSSIISVLSLFSHSNCFLSSFHILDWLSYFLQLLVSVFFVFTDQTYSHSSFLFLFISFLFICFLHFISFSNHFSSSTFYVQKLPLCGSWEPIFFCGTRIPTPLRISCFVPEWTVPRVSNTFAGPSLCCLLMKHSNLAFSHHE